MMETWLKITLEDMEMPSGICDGGGGSPPQSICFIRAAESFPKPIIEKEDDNLIIPFQELAGESVKYLGRTDDGVLALSNYRIFLHKDSVASETSVPLGLIETIQVRDLFHLVVMCKDASTVNCSFKTAEQCTEWQRRIQSSIAVPEVIESLFAFPFYAWTYDTYASNGSVGSLGLGNGNGTNSVNQNGDKHQPAPLSSSCSTTNDYFTERLQRASRLEDDFRNEIERLGFDLNGSWRVSNINADFKICSSYPESILVPCCVTDDNLECIANFRSSRRLPAVVWRHQKSGAVLARCSQPEVGWLGWRNYKDEQLLKAIADACAFDRGEQIRLKTANKRPRTISGVSIVDTSHEEIAMDEVKKMLIVDARSYTSAVTNRARGGGCESIDYYTCADIEFMNLGNIHAIRKSFHALRQLCASNPEDPGWLGQLEKTLWMQHLSGLLSSAMRVCHAIEKKERPVLVHCSDGWDRTPQIVATAQLCLDPHYRTVEGFRILVEREWLSFGHKFSDRCGNGPNADDLNERCPVFLQWLDMVHQIHKQFPCSFEFSLSYLIKLAQHSLSSLFGTFLCNTLKDRTENSVHERTFSVWPFLSGPLYRNPLYMPNKEKVLWPSHNVRFLCVWSEVYLGSLGNKNCMDCPNCNTERLTDSIGSVGKTRSYNDLSKAGGNGGVCQNDISRRSSDPNMIGDAKLNICINNCADRNSLDDICIDHDNATNHHKLTSKIVNDTTKKLEQLTLDINNQDEFNLILLHNNSANNNGTMNDEAASVAAIVPASSLPSQIMHSRNNDDNGGGGGDGGEHGKNHLLIVDYEQIKNNSTNNTSEDNYKENKSCNAGDGNNQNLKSQSSNAGVMGNEDQRIKDGTELDIQQAINLRKMGQKYPETRRYPDWPDLYDDRMDNLGSMQRNGDGNGDDHDDDVEIHQQQNSINDHNGKSLYQHIQVPEEVAAANNASGFLNAVAKAAAAAASASSSYIEYSNSEQQQQQQQRKEDNSNILPKVHETTTTKSRPNLLLKTIIKNTLSTSLENVHASHSNSNTNSSISNDNNKQSASSSSSSIIDEQNIILPEEEQCQFIIDDNMTAINTNSNGVNDHQASSASTLQKRLRVCRGHANNGQTTKNIDGTMSCGFALSGVRSLPMTPPGLPERAQITLSCPDGLAHALSEQNIRLHQIVQEHKLREDVLLREIHDMRIALLRKLCPNCHSGGPSTSDGEQCCGVETAENTSICSWEAVEDRSGPPSSSSSSVQQNAASVLWVPDHAVSRCTTCKTEFWIGRRKHHCRSCGRIFCADCSEFWAPLPNEKLFAPVRMCAACYETVQHDNSNKTTTAIATTPNAAMNFMETESSASSISLTRTSTSPAVAIVAAATTVASSTAAATSAMSGLVAVKVPVQPALAATTSNA